MDGCAKMKMSGFRVLFLFFVTNLKSRQGWPGPGGLMHGS